jgi:hypothetical protein
MSLTYDGVAVGDEVYCLAWVGKRFTIVGKDDDKRLVALEGDSATDPYGAQIDVFDETMWMVTDQPWDQIWYWPDRAGEHYQEVYERWVARQTLGRVVAGHLAETGIAAVGGFISPNPKRAMSFRIVSIDHSFAQTIVEPVVLVDDPARRPPVDELDSTEHEWVAVGPKTPLRITMITYRWAICFGDIILNWEDFAPREQG